MYCTKCGAQLPDDSLFCSKCGTAVAQNKDQADSYDPFAPLPSMQQAQPNQVQNQQMPHQQAAGGKKDDGIFGLLGFILSFFVPIAGLVLSIIGLNKTKNRGLAIAGLVISIISMVITLITSIIVASYFPYYMDDYYNYFYSI